MSLAPLEQANAAICPTGRYISYHDDARFSVRIPTVWISPTITPHPHIRSSGPLQRSGSSRSWSPFKAPSLNKIKAYRRALHQPHLSITSHGVLSCLTKSVIPSHVTRCHVTRRGLTCQAPSSCLEDARAVRLSASRSRTHRHEIPVEI